MVQQFWRRSRRSRRSTVPLKDRIFFSHYMTSNRFCLNNFTIFFSCSMIKTRHCQGEAKYPPPPVIITLIWRETLPVCFQTFPVHYWIQTEDTPSAHSKVVEQRRPLWVLLLLVLRLRGSTIKHSLYWIGHMLRLLYFIIF